MLLLWRALPLIGQIGFVLTLAAAVWGGYSFWRHQVYTEGYDAAIAVVEQANKEGVDAANKLKAIRRGCAGTWDQSRGVCIP